MTKDDGEFEKYWNSLASDPADSDELLRHCHFAAQNAFRAGRIVQRDMDAGICRKQAKLPECPERAMYCAEEIERQEIP